jgi:NADH-quinone oxidoreductase subunit N
MTLASLSLVWPEIILAVSAMVLLVLGAFRGKGGVVFNGLAVLALLVAAAFAVLGPQGRGFAGGVIVDDLSAFAKAAIYGASALSIILSDRWLTRRGEDKFELPVLILLAALGMGIMVSAGDLISNPRKRA